MANNGKVVRAQPKAGRFHVDSAEAPLTRSIVWTPEMRASRLALVASAKKRYSKG